MSAPNKRFMADCILFDIDGVLVDIRRSYNQTIRKTVNFVLTRLTNKKTVLNGVVTDELILKYRQTGGFNNDTDTAYAIILSVLTLLPDADINEIGNLLLKVTRYADKSGIESVEKYLFREKDISSLKEMLAYPSAVGSNIIGTVFDEIFYGQRLFHLQNGLTSSYYFGKPMIDNDKLIASERTFRKLADLVDGNLALVSGRSKLASEYTLEPIFKWFNKKACVFLEDEDRQYAKPNPYGILKAMNILSSKNAIYVGDSVEDLVMAREAEVRADVKIFFCGVYGCSPNPLKTIKQFKNNEVKIIAKNVNMLPNALNKVLTKR
jgi:phosphoglycolate phosphatase-like HAD superfamily hydrolase